VRLAIVLAMFAASPVQAEPRHAELQVVPGVLYPRGMFVEHRVCGYGGSPWFACVSVLVGEQRDETVFDLSLVVGRSFRAGRFDLTPQLGFGLVPVLVAIVELGNATNDAGDEDEMGPSATLLPIGASAGVGAGFTIVDRERLRVRVEAAVRGHLPLYEKAEIGAVLPRGVAGTLSLGIGY
jgi:hypothetical protein